MFLWHSFLSLVLFYYAAEIQKKNSEVVFCAMWTRANSNLPEFGGKLYRKLKNFLYQN